MIGYLPIFQLLPKLPYAQVITSIILNWTLAVLVIISQADPYDKTGDDIKGVANLTINQLFSRVSLLHHHYSITIILIENRMGGCHNGRTRQITAKEMWSLVQFRLYLYILDPQVCTIISV